MAVDSRGRNIYFTLAADFLGEVAFAGAFEGAGGMGLGVEGGEGEGAVGGTGERLGFAQRKIAHKRAQKVEPPAEAVAGAGAGGFVKTGPGPAAGGV